MKVYGVIIGVCLFAGGLYVAATSKAFAERMHRYWNRPRREGRFAWTDLRIATPSYQTSRMLVWLVGAAIGALGIGFVVTSLPE